MAKGDSEFAVAGPECQEVAGEHRRAVARPHRGRSPGTGDPDQAASMGVGPKTWARGEPDAWERARPVRRCGPGKRTLRKKHTAPRPDPYLTMARWGVEGNRQSRHSPAGGGRWGREPVSGGWRGAGRRSG